MESPVAVSRRTPTERIITRFDLQDDSGMDLCCRILSAYAGDQSAPWYVSSLWGFYPQDDATLIMYPHQRIKPRHAHRLAATVNALITAGYGGGTTGTVRVTEFTYPDGKRGAAIALRPEIRDEEVERYQQFYLQKYGRPA
jgi:hypothetical protein